MFATLEHHWFIFRDVSEVIKEEAVSWMKKEESAKESFFKSWRRKESSLEDLIDKRYSDRMDLSQVDLF